MIFFINKSEGKTTNAKAFKEYFEGLPDGRYRISVDSAKQRSLLQNAYYFGVVVELVYQGLRDAGFDTVRSKDDAHEILKALFLKVHEEHNGIKVERILSTTELSTTGMIEYVQNISIWAAEYLNVTIPEPNQQLLMNYE